VNRRQFFKSVFALPLLALPETDQTARMVAAPSFLLNCFSVAGFQYHDGPALLHRLRPGDPLTLTAEPDNPHDCLAVRIDYESRKLGYVPRSDNRPISHLLRQNAQIWCRVKEVNEDEWPWRAVQVEVGIEVGRNPK
jgi:hypothetical protein